MNYNLFNQNAQFTAPLGMPATTPQAPVVAGMVPAQQVRLINVMVVANRILSVRTVSIS